MGGVVGVLAAQLAVLAAALLRECGAVGGIGARARRQGGKECEYKGFGHG